MKKLKKYSGISTMIIIIMLLANLYLISVNLTKAKYISELYGTGSTNIANWEVVLKYSDISRSNNYTIPIELSPVPGDSTNFNITIDTTECKTSFPIKYEIEVEPVSTSIPTNVKFYIGSEVNSVLNTAYTGSMVSGESKNITITFKWNLTDANEDAFQNVSLKFNLKAKAYSSV